mmetsp:Transcript_49819/g.143376  ORF Transcript_49819/g.143376 Transcript_49819/m.143376 type:complete len:223 (-) Transcript_49819:470-1138(-)
MATFGQNGLRYPQGRRGIRTAVPVLGEHGEQQRRDLFRQPPEAAHLADIELVGDGAADVIPAAQDCVKPVVDLDDARAARVRARDLAGECSFHGHLAQHELGEDEAHRPHVVDGARRPSALHLRRMPQGRPDEVPLRIGEALAAKAWIYVMLKATAPEVRDVGPALPDHDARRREVEVHHPGALQGLQASQDVDKKAQARQVRLQVSRRLRACVESVVQEEL